MTDNPKPDYANIDFYRMTPQELDEKLCYFAHKCYLYDKAFVEAKEEYEQIHDKEDLYLEYLCTMSEGRSGAERRRLAIVTKEWEEFMKGMQAARAKMNHARVLKDAYSRHFDTCRSILSSKNNQMKFGV